MFFNTPIVFSQSYNQYIYEQEYYESIVPNFKMNVRKTAIEFVNFYFDGKLKLDETLTIENNEIHTELAMNFDKFMNKDSSELRQRIFIFCADFLESFSEPMSGIFTKFNLEIIYESRTFYDMDDQIHRPVLYVVIVGLVK